jgi:hypothetical protein
VVFMEEAIGERHTKATCELVDLVTGKGKPCLARFGSLADLRARIWQCPPYPQERTCSASALTSAKCH